MNNKKNIGIVDGVDPLDNPQRTANWKNSGFSQEIVIKRQKRRIFIDFKELWQYRELLMALVLRRVQVRYKQTLLGVIWVFLKPIISMVIFTVIFGKIVKFPSDNVPYPIFVLLGILSWNYFSSSVKSASSSIVAEAGFIHKIYFPRVLIPISSNLSCMLDLIISFALVIIMMIFYKIPPPPSMILSLLIIPVFFITALGPGLLFAAINIKYRDVTQMIAFITQIWMYMTPVLYPVNLVPEKYRLFLYLNPMTGPTEAFRYLTLGRLEIINFYGLGISCVMSAILFLIGLYYFRQKEPIFADII